MNGARPYLWPGGGLALPGAIAAARVALVLPFLGSYGIFRDEYYYLACAARLDWGYVDHPPLSIVLLAIWTALFGDGIVALRLPAALAGGATVFLAGILARELGGRHVAQALACLSVAIAPVLLAVSTFYSMNVLDQFFWTLLALILVRCLNTGNPRYWLLFGLVAGLALQNKLSVLALGFGVVTGLILTRYRNQFLTKELWLGGVIAGLVFLPHVLWQDAMGYPTVEFLRNASTLKNLASSPVQLFLGSLLEMHPANALLWLPGIAFTLYGKAGKRYRVIGVAFVTVFLVFGFTNGKVYYLAPAMPFALALGGVAWERWTRGHLRWRVAVFAPLVILGPLLFPLAIPMLEPARFQRYQELLGVAPAPMERHAPAPLPQHFADRFGWRELAVFIDGLCDRYIGDERQPAVVLVWNYGEAGALEYYQAEFNLPRVLCPHNNYYLWGPLPVSGPVLVYGGNLEELKAYFESVQPLDERLNTPLAMPYENNRPAFLCRGLKEPIESLWPKLKNYV